MKTIMKLEDLTTIDQLVDFLSGTQAVVSWSTESFGSASGPQHSDSMAHIVSFNRKLSRTRFRKSRCSPGHHGSIFPRAGRTALIRQYSMPSHWPTTPSYTRVPGPPIASTRGCGGGPK